MKLEKAMKIATQAIWQALRAGDIKSAWKLFWNWGESVQFLLGADDLIKE